MRKFVTFYKIFFKLNDVNNAYLPLSKNISPLKNRLLFRVVLWKQIKATSWAENPQELSKKAKD